MRRKPISKTWWFWIVFAILVVGAFALLGNNKVTKRATQTQPPATESTSEITPDPNLPTIEEIADKLDCKAGKLNATYHADTEYTHEDGTFIELNFQRITTHKVYGVNTNETLYNVIVIENNVSTPECRTFVRQIGTFRCYDAFGEELSQGDLYTQTGKQFAEIIIEVSKLDECSFILVGGLEFDQVLFPVS